MKNNNNFNSLISDFENYFRSKKSKRLHDPIFFGNETKYLKECISSGFVSYVGNFVNIFENKISNYTKSKYSIATSSGTAALHLALNYYNIDKDCEVLLPSYTYVATANAIKYCNSNPNFVDIETESLGVCPDKLELYLKKIGIRKGKKLINKYTKKHIKALIIVHIFGFPAKINEVKKICRKYNIYLIEDAAEAVGTFFKKKHLGTFGDMGILSFNGNKTITSGGGGIILVKTKKAANYIKHLSTHAKVKIGNDFVHDQIGFNYRMTNLSAAVGCAQLENIGKIIKAKRKNFNDYYKIFKRYKEIKIIKEPSLSKTNYWLITAVFKSKSLRNKFINILNKKGFGLRYTWKPLHSLDIFKNCPSDNMINSNKLYNNAVNLPSSPILNIKK